MHAAPHFPTRTIAEISGDIEQSLRQEEELIARISQLIGGEGVDESTLTALQRCGEYCDARR